MAQSGASFVPDIGRLINPILQGIQTGQNRDLANRKLALLQEIQRGDLDVNQREIALKELQRVDEQEAQEKIQNVLSEPVPLQGFRNFSESNRSLSFVGESP